MQSIGEFVYDRPQISDWPERRRGAFEGWVDTSMHIMNICHTISIEFRFLIKCVQMAIFLQIVCAFRMFPRP